VKQDICIHWLMSGPSAGQTLTNGKHGRSCASGLMMMLDGTGRGPVEKSNDEDGDRS
jgi:hypothetical protein